VRSILHTLPPAAQAAILEDLNKSGANDDPVTAQIPRA
jgi:phospholipid/cholesterol/gamma-HCH transport system ATP-binding protein